MEESCGLCGRPFDSSTVIPINGSKEEVDELRRSLADSRLALKAKRGRKRKQLLPEISSDVQQIA